MSVVVIAEAVEKGLYNEGMHPVVELRESEMNEVKIIALGRSDTGYNNPDEDDYNTDFSSAANAKTSREQHEKGAFGEAVVAKHHSDDYTIHGLDDELTRSGDGGVDLEIDGTAVDVKTTDYGYACGRTPLLKVKQDCHRENMERIQNGDEDVDELMYYCVERINETTGRIIGYITASAFDGVAEEVNEGETYRAGEDGYNWTSRADNLVAEPSDLWLSYRDD
ncbi:hypothetical protein [Halopenitus persicus]|uniref:hypothetical protein n=1 Tax=Halopenitus persicus TaxID=1048396 RepID=UPI000BBA81A4|nr:hypothetical protein [Halopenitus persicus]